MFTCGGEEMGELKCLVRLDGVEVDGIILEDGRISVDFDDYIQAGK